MITDKGYHTYQGYECLSACISNYLRWKNINISASDIFFLGNGFRLFYENDTERILSDMYMSNYSFMKAYHINYESRSAENEKVAKTILHESILNEEMIMIKVAAEGLKYNRIYQQAGDSQHFLNMIGRNDIAVYVSDGFVPTRKFSIYEGWVDLENILEVWKKKNYDYYVITSLEISGNDKDIHEKVKQMIISSIVEYVDVVQKDNTIYGYSAMIHVIDNLREKLLDKDYPLSERTLYLNHQLRVYGFLSAKKMLLEEMIHYGIKGDLCDEYQMIVERWSKWLMKMVKIGFSRSLNDFEMMYSDMIRILEKEDDLLMLIAVAFKEL